jgi:Protein kinase domain
VQLLAALRAAHDPGIVHRDVKPSNVLLETSGRVVLTDVGIAPYKGATTLTQTATFMGSLAYVAPEVASGEPASVASDLRRMREARTGELLSAAATPPAHAPPPRRVRPRRLAAHVGLVPAVTVGVLTLAVAAGVPAGVKDTPALYSGDDAPLPPAPGTTSAAPRSPSAKPGGGPLPATLGGGTGGPEATRLAHGGASRPATSAVTLKLEGRHGRVSVVVTCPSGVRRLPNPGRRAGGPGSAGHALGSSQGMTADELADDDVALRPAVAEVQVAVQVTGGFEQRGRLRGQPRVLPGDGGAERVVAAGTPQIIEDRPYLGQRVVALREHADQLGVADVGRREAAVAGTTSALRGQQAGGLPGTERAGQVTGVDRTHEPEPRLRFIHWLKVIRHDLGSLATKSQWALQ